jgi:DNA-binding CsgD family transcriptional regulator
MVQGCEGLTEKEKQTLRLLLVGHDAKSMARYLGLSVHTINERLRDARRKLSVSSSKEAARLLRDSEAAAPELVGYTPFGGAPPAPIDQLPDQRDHVPPTQRRAGWALGGLAMIPIFAVTLALLAPAQAPQAGIDAPAATETVVTKAARDWLALVDAGKWEESWAATAQSFRSLNTVGAWRSASEKVRVPLGQVLSRTLISEQNTPAPPNGYRTVLFRTDFANKRGATETISLDRENDGWKIVGIYVE